jgi:hypothetical protein
MPQVRQGIQQMNIFEKARQYLNGVSILTEWLGYGALTVAPKHAQDRADICTGRLNGAGCPNNVKEFEVTEAVSQAIRTQVELKSKLQLRVQGEKALHTCKNCGCPLKLKVWLEIQQLGLDANEVEKLPEICWMKTEFKSLKP